MYLVLIMRAREPNCDCAFATSWPALERNKALGILTQNKLPVCPQLPNHIRLLVCGRFLEVVDLTRCSI
jgi:hypothetical protein